MFAVPLPGAVNATPPALTDTGQEPTTVPVNDAV
jgi:hypothetical protein